MAEKAKKRSDENILINKIDVRSINRTSQDIQSWRNAITSAESVFNPTRKQLYDLYHDILLDGHLWSVVDKRLTAITNTPIQFTDEGEPVEDINNLMDTESWHYMLKELLNARFWGYTLLELTFLPDNIKAELINRKHVKPEMGLVVRNAFDMEGVRYLEPPYDRYIVTAGETKDMGLFMKVAQYVIYKRGGFADWAQFAEIFGMPFREGRYDPYDEATRKELLRMMEETGGAAYAVLPKGSEFQLHQASQTSGSNTIYQDLKDACNQEISKAIVGQTLTTEQGDKGARSLGDVHQQVEADIHTDDKRFIINILNNKLRPLLEEHGYPVGNGRFIFPEIDNLDKKSRLEMDLKLAKQVPVSDDYFYQTYSIPKPENYDELKEERQLKTSLFKQEEPPDKKPSNNLFTYIRNLVNPPHDITGKVNALYAPCPDCGGHIVNIEEDEAINKRAEKLAKMIHEGTITKDVMIDRELTELVAAKISEAMFKGFGKTFENIEFGTPDAEMLANLERNVYQFSSAKNYHQLRQMTDALKSPEGEILSFNDFKKKALQINKVYNFNWLQTEYNTAITSAEGAANWSQYMEGAEEMPILEYQTAGDDRVRDSHAALDGVKRRYDDDFWKRYYPPNGFNCRCTTMQHAERNTKQTNMRKVSIPEVPSMFRTNLAKSGLVFPKKHPYWNIKKSDLNKVMKQADFITPVRQGKA